jgi:putative endonuclease
MGLRDSVCVYALRFADETIYVGLTKDLSRRQEEHRRRQSPSTLRFNGEFRLIYHKWFSSYADARRHEKYLKSGRGRQFLKSVRT